MLEFSINGKKYSIISDLHTHTVYSHGSGSIEDNVIAARLRNLKTIGITDHGPGHIAYGFRRSRIPEMQAEIERLREKYDDIEILFGVEANIANPSGAMDIREDEFELFDIIIAGIHYGALGGNPVSGAARSLSNLVSRSRGSEPGNRLIQRNTAMVVNAIENNPVSILTHPGENAPVDLLEIAVACAKTGTLIELNTSHLSLSPDDIRTMALADVDFIITSDAHSQDHVGDFVASVRVAIEADLDPARIINLKAY